MSEEAIVPFQQVHLETVVSLEREVFAGRDPWSRNAFERELLATHTLWLVAEIGGEVAGYGGGWVVGGEFRVLNLAVKPPCRRRGIAGRLLNALFAAAVRRGCHGATLEVRKGNVAARALYEKLGFRIEGERRGYYSNGDDALLCLLPRMTPLAPTS